MKFLIYYTQAEKKVLDLFREVVHKHNRKKRFQKQLKKIYFVLNPSTQSKSLKKLKTDFFFYSYSGGNWI